MSCITVSLQAQDEHDSPDKDHSQKAEWTIKKAIQELVQLNEGHKYSYDRDSLVKMLDEALLQ